MQNFIESFQLLNEIKLETKISKQAKLLKDYDFIYLSDKNKINQNEMNQKIKDSNIIIINQYVERSTNNAFFIIGFRKTIIVINDTQVMILFMKLISSKNKEIAIYYFYNVENSLNYFQELENPKIKCTPNFQDEIISFNNNFEINSSFKQVIQVWNIIRPCITGYLIRESYDKINNNQKKIDFSLKNIEIKTWGSNDYIELRKLGQGSTSIVNLIYNIENESLFALIKPIGEESEKLYSRQFNNYQNINHPRLPKLYAKVKGKNYFIIQFINGHTLQSKNDYSKNLYRTDIYL